MTEKTILVTGGAGYIGLHAILALQEAGYQPVAVDDLSRGRKDLLPAGVPLYTFDINDTEKLTALCREIKPVAIFHLAARLSVEESTQIPLSYYQTNVAGTISVCKAMVAAQVPHMVFSSTCCVYGEAGGIVDEATPLAAYSPYGASKAMAERVIVDAAAAHGFTYATLRYFNVTGADLQMRAGPYTHTPVLLVDRIAQAVYGDLPHLTVHGTDYATADGTAIRDYIHVTDLVVAHIDALNYLVSGKESTAFNCGYGRGLSVKQMIDAAKEISKVDFPVHFGPRRAGDIAEIAANCSMIKNRTGWTPRYDTVEDMIGTVLSWYKQQTGRAG
jgi:UDP-glucose 4-epimerase